MFKSINEDLLFKKNDPKDIRLGELIKKIPIDEVKNSFVVLGYPDDEGIKNSGGRIGAKLAPDAIRKYLYKMTPHLFEGQDQTICDIGNFESSSSLFEKHTFAGQEILKLLKNGNSILSLGGGHDYGYPDGFGFLKAYSDQKNKPLIINFDAHLDVRPLKDKITSGTPFFRLLNEFKDSFDFLEIGIQSQCNSKSHYEWALSHGVKILSYDQILFSGQNATLEILKFLEPYTLKARPVFLSLDMDCFSSAFAPGCSQVFSTGLNPEDFLRVFDVLLKRLNVCLFGIYEASPELDIDDKTTKLAAILANKFLATKK